MSYNPITLNLPQKWNVLPLKELANYISRGKQPKYVEESDIFTLNQKAIRWGEIDTTNLKKHNPDIKVPEQHFIIKDDVVINSTGTGTVGRVFHFRENPEYIMFADSHVTIVRTNKKLLNPRYLMYLLSTERYQDYIINNFVSGSTGQVELNKSKVMEFPILFPPIKEQDKIVGILDSLDQKIDINYEIISNLETLVHSIFKHWFTKFEFLNDEKQPYRSAGGKIIESELGYIPIGWQVGTLGDLIKIGSGKRPKNKTDNRTYQNNIPIIGASKVMGYTSESLFSEPIIVTGRVGTHGIIQRFNDPCWPSDNTLVIKSDYYEYVYQLLKTIDFRSLNRGSTQPLITQTDIKNIKVIIPSKEVLETFEQDAKLFFDMLYEKKKENETLKKIRDTILPQLISGEIRVQMESEG